MHSGCMAFIAPKHESALRPRAEVNKKNAIHPKYTCYNCLISSPEGTATIATALRCLTMRANSFIVAISYKIIPLS